MIHAVRVFDDKEANNTTSWNAILRKNASEYHSEIYRCFDVTQQIPVIIVGLTYTYTDVDIMRTGY